MRQCEARTLTLTSAGVADLMGAVLEKGGRFGFLARGTSMVPFLRDGDVLTIASLDNRQPRLGDVLAFSYPGEKGPNLVVHRIVGYKRPAIVLQGDGNGCTPEIISSERILGRLVKVERDGRRVRLGLGPERRLIAWLSRTRLLWTVVWPVWHRVREFLNR